MTRIQAPRKIELIDDGLACFERRIDLIESAKETIELEFFIYELDLAARLISDKLIEKAAEGVKVRLLVDFSAPVFKLKPQFANFIKQNSVDVRYYNTSSLLDLVAVQHRNHRKFLIVDGKYALTGGRNVANDYFNLSNHYNFLDSDILIEGPIVSNIKSSFNLYWTSEYSVEPEEHKGPSPELDSLIKNTENDRNLFEDIEKQKEALYSTDAYYTVSALAFSIDELLKTNLSLHAYNGSVPGHYSSSLHKTSEWLTSLRLGKVLIRSEFL